MDHSSTVSSIASDNESVDSFVPVAPRQRAAIRNNAPEEKTEILSQAFQDVFLSSRREKLDTTRLRKIQLKKSNLNATSDIALYEHVWLQPFADQAISLANQLGCMPTYGSASFSQVVSLSQLNFTEFDNVCHCLDLSVNRLRSLDTENVDSPQKTTLLPSNKPVVAAETLDSSNVADSAVARVAGEKSAERNYSDAKEADSKDTDSDQVKPKPCINDQISTPLALTNGPGNWIRSVVFLNVSSNLLLSLSGLQYFTALRVLEVSDNLLVSYAAATACTSLACLRVAGNRINAIAGPEHGDSSPVAAGLIGASAPLMPSAEPLTPPASSDHRRGWELSHLDVSENPALGSLRGVQSYGHSLLRLEAKGCGLTSLLPLKDVMVCLQVLRVDNNFLPSEPPAALAETMGVLASLRRSLRDVSLVGNPLAKRDSGVYTVAVLDAVYGLSHEEEVKDRSVHVDAADTSTDCQKTRLLKFLDYRPVDNSLFDQLESLKAEVAKERLVADVTEHYVGEMNLVAGIHSSLLARQSADAERIEALVRTRTAQLERLLSDFVGRIRESTKGDAEAGRLTIATVDALRKQHNEATETEGDMAALAAAELGIQKHDVTGTAVNSPSKPSIIGAESLTAITRK